jgi:uridine phosphorylase
MIEEISGISKKSVESVSSERNNRIPKEENMDLDNKLPILRALPSQIAEQAIVVGDPSRAEKCASFLDSAEEVGHYREYLTFTGIYKDMPITICSHGVGSSGASVAFHELFVGGAKTIIRAGTCGAMQRGIKDGDLIIGTGAVRRDGTTQRLIPTAYPAVSHFEITHALQTSCFRNGILNPQKGIMLTNANFYPGLLPFTKKLWMEAGVIAVEMEFAALLVMASMRGLKAGGIFVSDGNLAEDETQTEMEDFAYDPHRDIVERGVQLMLKIALKAIISLKR